jgi:hypothetical protein
MEVLESSNSLLKKQVIASISNEEAAIKEMLNTKEESKESIRRFQFKMKFINSCIAPSNWTSNPQSLKGSAMG